MRHITDAGRARLAGTLLACFGLLSLFSTGSQAQEDALQMRGNVRLEYLRLPRFEGEGGVTNPLQKRDNVAFKGQLDASYRLDARWNAGLRAFVREDFVNDDRDDVRLDEAWVQYGTPSWDLRVGNQLVTWGSVESVSPLDIVNPRDYEEDIVEPLKMGVTMARLRWRLERGDMTVYWLPGFEPSRFAGPHSYYAIGGGLRDVYPDTRWQTNQWAARYFQTYDGFDIGVSYVQGLERNADFEYEPSTNALVGTLYESRRYGTDITWVIDDLVLKAEAVWRTSDREGNRHALLYALGTEYTLSSVWGHSDLSLFAEYLASSSNVRDIELMQNDLFAALRWTFNDQYKQRLQVGTFADLDQGNARVWRIEHQISPWDNVDVGARYTATRHYYPGPRHVEPRTGVLQFFIRFNM
jgi:hypothetical protein